jgi:prepilin-type N-terminal cleavage/methylation domain-containing protein
MKSKTNQNNRQSGFTLVEMLVVISMMMMLSAALVVDFNSQRGVRGVKIAQNETATNIRKVQGYTLSSRNLPNDAGGARFYLMEFNSAEGNNTIYNIGAVARNSVTRDYEYIELETVKLPSKVKIASVATEGTATSCLQIIFTVPFGTMYSCIPHRIVERAWQLI